MAKRFAIILKEKIKTIKFNLYRIYLIAHGKKSISVLLSFPPHLNSMYVDIVVITIKNNNISIAQMLAMKIIPVQVEVTRTSVIQASLTEMK